MPLVSRTRATLRSAEFGFFGVVVYTRVHTPRRWGEPFSAGVLVFSTLSSRPLRTSWLIVGMGGLDLLPALGRALDVVLCSWWSGSAMVRWCPVVPVLLGGPPGPGRHPPSGPRGRACCPSPEPAAVRRTGHGRPSRLGAATPPATTSYMAGRRTPVARRRPPDTQAHREREQAQGTLGTADHDTRASKTGANRVPLSTGAFVPRGPSGGTPRRPDLFPPASAGLLGPHAPYPRRGSVGPGLYRRSCPIPFSMPPGRRWGCRASRLGPRAQGPHPGAGPCPPRGAGGRGRCARPPGGRRAGPGRPRPGEGGGAPGGRGGRRPAARPRCGRPLGGRPAGDRPGPGARRAGPRRAAAPDTAAAPGGIGRPPRRHGRNAGRVRA